MYDQQQITDHCFKPNFTLEHLCITYLLFSLLQAELSNYCDTKDQWRTIPEAAGHTGKLKSND